MAERYVAPWYYKQTDYSGNMRIYNDSVNYDDSHYSTVSGNGAVLNGGAGDDTICNYGDDNATLDGGQERRLYFQQRRQHFNQRGRRKKSCVRRRLVELCHD